MAKFKRISLPRIKQAAEKMAEAVQPEKIILFGSYAYGKPNGDSDVDFLVVVPQKTREARHKIYIKASKALDPHTFPCDIVVRSQRDIPWRIKEGDFFLQDILENGRVLYER
jgi:predicted nucleotidyltransferase